MSPRPRPIPPQPGRHRRFTDPGRKARRFPTGSARARLWRILRPPTFDDHVLTWLGLRSLRRPPKQPEPPQAE